MSTMSFRRKLLATNLSLTLLKRHWASESASKRTSVLVKSCQAKVMTSTNTTY